MCRVNVNECAIVSIFIHTTLKQILFFDLYFSLLFIIDLLFTTLFTIQVSFKQHKAFFVHFTFKS